MRTRSFFRRWVTRKLGIDYESYVLDLEEFIQSYYVYEKFGIDYRRATLSTQICAGGISRECAIEQLKNKPYDPEIIEQDKQYTAKKLGISKDEILTILSLQPKWYWDYPNDDKKLAFIYDAYRMLFKKEKLDRF